MPTAFRVVYHYSEVYNVNVSLSTKVDRVLEPLNLFDIDPALGGVQPNGYD